MRYLGICLSIALATMYGFAYDLTPDRGSLDMSTFPAGAAGQFYFLGVFNIRPDKWGETSTCNMQWAVSQFRDESGVRIGSVSYKPSQYQEDTDPMEVGWFEPGSGYGTTNCSGSHITGGWGDGYGAVSPATPSNISIKPTFHVKIDPNYAFLSGDENRVNNEVWKTYQWDAPTGQFLSMENMDLPGGANIALNNSDSLFYGVYSTDANKGNINITNATRTVTLSGGNRKMGFQARRMKVQLLSGKKNSYTIKGGGKVTAEFLGFNHY